MCREGRRCFPPSKSSRSSPPSPRRCRLSSPSTRMRSNCLSCLPGSPFQRSCLFLHRPPCSRWRASVLKVAPSGSPCWLLVFNRVVTLCCLAGGGSHLFCYHFGASLSDDKGQNTFSAPLWSAASPQLALLASSADRGSERLPASVS